MTEMNVSVSLSFNAHSLFHRRSLTCSDLQKEVVFSLIHSGSPHKSAVFAPLVTGFFEFSLLTRSASSSEQISSSLCLSVNLALTTSG